MSYQVSVLKGLDHDLYDLYELGKVPLRGCDWREVDTDVVFGCAADRNKQKKTRKAHSSAVERLSLLSYNIHPQKANQNNSPNDQRKKSVHLFCVSLTSENKQVSRPLVGGKTKNFRTSRDRGLSPSSCRAAVLRIIGTINRGHFLWCVFCASHQAVLFIPIDIQHNY